MEFTKRRPRSAEGKRENCYERRKMG